MPDVLKCFWVLFRILDQYINYKFVLAVFGCQVSCLFVVAALSAHRYSRVEIKLEISWRLYKSLEFFNVFQLGIAVQ